MHIVQLAYHVPNAEAAALEWVQHHGAGPFFLSEHIPLEDVIYRGQPGSLDHTSAYGWCGGHMVELVQQNCDAPSVFTDAPFGLHHCACFAADLDTELERLSAAGYTTAMRAGTQTGVQFAFARNSTTAVAPIGHYLEIYGDHPALRGFYQMVEESALNWDGSEPVRRPG